MKYPAHKLPDGSWVIKDVPIFAEHKRTLKNGVDVIVDAKWMSEAVERAQQRKNEDGYLPPLNKNHHRTPDNVEFVGHFIPTHVGDIVYEGRKIKAMFADLVGINDEDMADIQAGNLPYRSVEIEDVTSPEIACLSLLDHNPPYFKFPNLEVEVSHEPVLAYRSGFRKSKSYQAIISFKESQMSKKAKGAKKATAAEYMEDEEKDETIANSMKTQDAVMPPAGPDKMDILIAMMQKLLDAVGGGDETTPEESENMEVAPAQAQAQLDAQYKAKIAELEGAITGLSKKVDQSEKKATYSGKIEEATKAVAPYHVTRAEVVKYAKDNGLDALAGFVIGIKRGGKPDPRSARPVNYSSAVQAGEPEYLKKYAANPRVLAIARKAAVDYARQSSDVRAAHTEEDYVKYQIIGISMNTNYAGQYNNEDPRSDGRDRFNNDTDEAEDDEEDMEENYDAEETDEEEAATKGK